jgi:hypothetical protein
VRKKIVTKLFSNSEEIHFLSIPQLIERQKYTNKQKCTLFSLPEIFGRGAVANLRNIEQLKKVLDL